MICHFFFIFSKNQLLILLIFVIVSFSSFSFISILTFMISFLLLTFCFCCCCCFSYFSRCLRCRVRLSIQCFSFFLRHDFITINFPLRTTFAVYHRLWVIVFSLSFVSMNLFISFLISSVTSLIFSNELFHLHKFVFFCSLLSVVDN